MAELNWTDAHWQKVNDAVTEAFGKASVAGAFLPMYGPLTGSAEIVRNERLQQSKSWPHTISLDTDHSGVNLKLVNLTVKVELSSEQVADESLSNALLVFRRAANILALQQDRIVFRGFRRDIADQDSGYVANQVGPQKGMADLYARQGFERIRPSAAKDSEEYRAKTGQDVVSHIVRAIGKLEQRSNPGPFACVLGDELFNSVHTPSSSLVLPADRITPQLKGGPLLRSGMLDAETGIVVSLAANAVDIVVGTPPTVQFLQRQPDAKYLFRVYERFVLRFRDDEMPPVAGFRIEPSDERARAEVHRLKDVAAKAAVAPFTEVENRVRKIPGAVDTDLPSAAKDAILRARADGPKADQVPPEE